MRHLILPIINTKRLTLRPLTLEDSVSLFEYAKSDLVGPSAGWKPHKTVDETVQFIEYAIKKRDYGQPGIFAIVLKRGKKMIGTIEIHSFKDHKGEIGFVLNQKYWINDSQSPFGMGQYCDYIIECRTDGSFFYIKNRRDGSTEVLPQDGSYDWITVQILSSRRFVAPKRGFEAGAFYAPYVPLIIK